MATALVTGATGLVGRRLVPRLAESHEIVVLSRGKYNDPGVSVRGNFTSAADLHALDNQKIDVAVHLAAVLDDAHDELCFAVNVAGAAALLTYLVNRNCHRLVLASSIGATGCLGEGFVPRRVPIGDDHPCYATDAYGISKALMEELAVYFQRRRPKLEIALMRIGAVVEADLDFFRTTSVEHSPTPFALGGVVSVADVAEALALAVERPLGPGVRRFNLVGPNSLTEIPVVEALTTALAARGAQLDGLGYFAAANRETASLFAIDRLSETLGFRPEIDPRTLTHSQRN